MFSLAKIRMGILITMGRAKKIYACNHIKTPRISARRPQRGAEIVVYGGYFIGAIFFGVWTTSNCLARKSNPFCVTRTFITVNDSWLLRSINFSFNSK